MKKNLLLSICLFFTGITYALAAPPTPFTAGNLVVLRYGDGISLIPSTEQVPTFLDEYTPTGTLVQTIPLPITTVGNQRALTGKNVYPAEGTNNINAEGMLIRSANGAYLTFVGHEAAPYTMSSAVTTSVIGRVSATGEVNTTTALPSAVVTPYAAVSKDGTQFWISGVRGSSAYKGVIYVPFEYNKGLTSSLGVGTGIGGANTTLSLNIFNETLIYSNAGTIRPFVGAIPETLYTGSTDSYPGFGTGSDPSSTQFIMFDSNGDGSNDLMYLINDRINATTPVTGKIMKYLWNGTTWVKKEYITVPSKTDNMRFLTAKIEAGIATIYCTGPSGLYKLTNNIAEELSASNLSLLVAAPANTTFRGVAFAPVATTQPVKLTSFTGKPSTEGVQLNWITSSEKNNARFEILRSGDNNNFSVIGTVKGNNNSDQILNYSFIDANPLAGTNYYQLNQIDYDEKSEKSAVIAIDYNGNSTVLSAHFSSNNQLDISISSDKTKNAELYLTDVSGKIIVSEKILLKTGLNSKTLHVKGIVQGVYVLNLVSEKERVSIKLLK